MNKLTFDHIGVACSDINTMITYMTKFFKIESISEAIFDPLQNATLCMLIMQDGTKIELISGKIVEKIIKKRNYLYHTCYQVSHLEEAIEALEQEGSVLISEPQPARLFNERRVAFLTSNIGIIELLERS